MPNVDDIINKLLGDRRIREGAAFSTRTFSDQPIIERGSDYRQRVAKREQERAEREAKRAERERRIAQREEERAIRRQAQEDELRREREVTLHQQQEAARRSGTGAYAPAKRDPNQRTIYTTYRNRDVTIRMPRHQTETPSPAPERVQQEHVPARIREMRKLEGRRTPAQLAYGSNASAALFLQQARLMEDYEDDYEFHGSFSQYYPTYAAMSNHQLRGYFAWRTEVRAGRVAAAPVSFAFVFLYELLNGVGTTPGRQGLRDLRAFGQAWAHAMGEQPNTLARYLEHWTRDYAIYHGLTDQIKPDARLEVSRQALVLLQAEHAQLARDKREPRIPNTAAQGVSPTPQQVFEALGATSSYHLCDSRLAKAEPELTAAVASDVFAALVAHCSKRRKTDFVEGLFGYAYRTPYTMFSAAVFCEEDPHPNATVVVNDFDEFVCSDGRWVHHVPIEGIERNKELGRIMHHVDYELRRQLDYTYPLKEKPVPKYVDKIVRDAVAARLEERAQAEARRINIDLSKLKGIRAAAAVTQEALLTDEERGIEEVAEPPIPPLAAHAGKAGHPEPTPAGQPDAATAASPHDDAPAPAPVKPTKTQGVPAPAPAPAPAPQTTTATEGPLDELERRFLQGLVDGVPAAQLLGPTDPFVSVVADTINEKLFDLVGDAVIEFDGDEPRLIEDYLEDIREVL